MYGGMNVAGMMGKMSAQPAKRKQTVDPLERLNQKMAGRTKGGSMEGLKKTKKRKSMMGSYGSM